MEHWGHCHTLVTNCCINIYFIIVGGLITLASHTLLHSHINAHLCLKVHSSSCLKELLNNSIIPLLTGWMERTVSILWVHEKVASWYKYLATEYIGLEKIVHTITYYIHHKCWLVSHGGHVLEYLEYNVLVKVFVKTVTKFFFMWCARKEPLVLFVDHLRICCLQSCHDSPLSINCCCWFPMVHHQQCWTFL